METPPSGSRAAQPPLAPFPPCRAGGTPTFDDLWVAECPRISIGVESYDGHQVHPSSVSSGGERQRYISHLGKHGGLRPARAHPKATAGAKNLIRAFDGRVVLSVAP